MGNYLFPHVLNRAYTLDTEIVIGYQVIHFRISDFRLFKKGIIENCIRIVTMK